MSDSSSDSAVYTWDITDIQVYPSYNSLENVVVNVKWSFTCAYQGQTGATQGDCELDLPSESSPDFIPFSQLTKDIVLGWVKVKLGSQEEFFKTFTKNLVVNQLKQSPVSAGLPWATSA
jgi:hypothetical protein